jgi:hypothetical protein
MRLLIRTKRLVRRDGVVVNMLALRPRVPGFNSWSDRTLPSRSSCGQAVNSQLRWRGNEAVHEGCDHWFVFTMRITLIAMLYMSAIYVYHYIRLFVCANCGLTVVLLKEIHTYTT